MSATDYTQLEKVPVELITHEKIANAPSAAIEQTDSELEKVPAELQAELAAPSETSGVRGTKAATIVGGLGGAGLGATYAGAKAVKDVGSAAIKAALQAQKPEVAKAVSTLLPGTERWKQSANQISEAAKKVVQDTNVRKRAPQFTRADWAMKAQELSPMAEKLAALQPVGKFLMEKGGKYLNPIIAGGLAGAQGLNALDKLKTDPVGAAIGAVGAGAGLASMYPPAAPIALPVSLAAEGINYLRDDPDFMKKFLANTKPVGKADGGIVDILSNLNPLKRSKDAYLSQAEKDALEAYNLQKAYSSQDSNVSSDAANKLAAFNNQYTQHAVSNAPFMASIYHALTGPKGGSLQQEYSDRYDQTLQKHTAQDKARHPQYATGGLVYLADGGLALRIG